MSLATYWIEDPLTPLPALPGFDVVIDLDYHELSKINRLSQAEGLARLNGGHLPYVARMDGQPVGYGWVATRNASIGELDLNFNLSPNDRYLWDFATLPDWQGRGLYPRLLQTILERESKNANRFWIIHAPENLPSGAGMNKAGFEFVGQLSFTSEGSVGLAPFSDTLDRANCGANLLNVPLIDSVLAPCWHCGGMVAKLPDRADLDSCWPPKRTSESVCCCAVEVKSLKRMQS
jgi:GNAT superfamily N-acetyltransferase